VVQKNRNMCPERSQAMVKQVKEMVVAGILREGKYHSWIADSVMVRKKIDHGECVLNTKTSTGHVPKMLTPSWTSIPKLTLWLLSNSNVF
jgi:hypothetical protein